LKEEIQIIREEVKARGVGFTVGKNGEF